MASTGHARRPEWIERQLVRRGIHDERVLDAFARVPRAPFVRPEHRERSLSDAPIPIGCGQTVSQPFVIALSLAMLHLTGKERVLDVGTGSGYQTALLAQLAAEVYSIEIHDDLLSHARVPLHQYARAPLHLRCGDGSLGWPEAAPFDAIVAGACAPQAPPALLGQLATGGRMVLPIGGDTAQALYLFEKDGDGSIRRRMLERVVFVPLLGAQGVGRYPAGFRQKN